MKLCEEIDFLPIVPKELLVPLNEVTKPTEDRIVLTIVREKLNDGSSSNR